MPASGRRRRRGYTLVEVLLSVGAAGVLLTGTSAALVLTLQAAAPENTGTLELARVSAQADPLLTELAYASAVTALTNTSIRFEVVVPGSGGTTEELYYAWSGTAGDPLTLSVDGGTPVTVVEDVQQFQLTPLTRCETETVTVPVMEESEEFELAHFWIWDGTGGSLYEYAISPSQLMGEWIDLPVLASSVSCRITRCYIAIRRTSMTQVPNVTVAIHPAASAGSHDPADAPIGTPATFSASSIGSTMQWKEVAFSDVEFDCAGMDGICFVCSADGFGTAVRYLQAWSPEANGMEVRYSTDGGAVWGPSAAQRHDYDMRYYLYGTVSTLTTGTITETHTFLTGLELELTAGLGADPVKVRAATHVLNQVEIPGG